MNTRTLLIQVVVCYALLPVGVVNADAEFSDVVQMAPDTYSISRTDHGGIFGNAGKMRTKVIQEANDFAQSKGKVAVMSYIQENPMGAANFASIEYTFWVLDKDDVDAHRIRVRQEPNVRVEVEQRTPAPSATQPIPALAKPDLYTELSKLDDLHKRGILTDAEFEQQKQKSIASH
jgi:hypothetical protein